MRKLFTLFSALFIALGVSAQDDFLNYEAVGITGGDPATAAFAAEYLAEFGTQNEEANMLAYPEENIAVSVVEDEVTFQRSVTVSNFLGVGDLKVNYMKDESGNCYILSFDVPGVEGVEAGMQLMLESMLYGSFGIMGGKLDVAADGGSLALYIVGGDFEAPSAYYYYLTFSKAGDAGNKPAVWPEEGTLDEIETIEIDFGKPVTLVEPCEENFYWVPSPSLESADGSYSTAYMGTLSVSAFNPNVVVCTFEKAVKADVVVFTIPTGCVAFEDGTVNSLYKYTYTISGANDSGESGGGDSEPVVVTATIEPAEGVVESLQNFIVMVDGWGDVQSQDFMFPVIKNADGDVVATCFNGIEMGCNVNFEEAITEPGVYTLEVPAMVSQDWFNYHPTTMTFTYTILGGAESEVVLYEGEAVGVNWNQPEALTFTTDKLAGIKAGDKIIVTAEHDKESAEGWPQVSLRDMSWGEIANAHVAQVDDQQTLTFTVTPAWAKLFNQAGFFFTGAGAKVSKVVWVKDNSGIDYSNAIWIGPKDIDGWATNVMVAGVSFADAQPGDQVIIYATGAEAKDEFEPVLGVKDNSYADITDPSIPQWTDMRAGKVEFTLNQAVIDILKNGMILQSGGKMTITHVDLISATGITSIDVPQTNSGVMYNLSGQPVSEGYKGIVIRDGKKFMIK